MNWVQEGAELAPSSHHVRMREQVAVCSLEEGPHQNLNVDFQNCEKRISVSINHPVCGTLRRQLKRTKTGRTLNLR